MTSGQAICLAITISAVFFAAVWIIVVVSRRKWSYVSFTPHRVVHDLQTDKFVLLQDEVDFQPRLGHYLKTSEVVITLASASLVFIPKLTVTAHPEWFAFSMTLFGLTVLYLVLFMITLLYFYEDSLYFPTYYTVKKSAAVVAMGFAGLLCFITAYMSIAVQIAKAVGDKAVLVK
jgi:hypothetical protein